MKRLFLALVLASPVSGEPKLSPDAQAKLDANGLVIVDQPLLQGFSAYIDAERPVFVTSDSLLMAYHRIFEELVSQETLGEMAALIGFWPSLWTDVSAKPLSDSAEDIEAHRRARLFVATAYRLLFGKLPTGLEEDEITSVLREAERVEEGKGDSPPSWLQWEEQESVFIDYQAFLPGDLVSSSAIFPRYYRCRKWLQEMKFDCYQDPPVRVLEHLAAAVCTTAPELAGPVTKRSFFTDGGGLLNSLEYEFGKADGTYLFPKNRKRLRKLMEAKRFRTVFAAATPIGSELARELLEKDDPTRLPEIIAASAGNALALSRLNRQQKSFVGPQVSQEADLLYFVALTELNKSPDPRAPALLRSEAWQRKQLNATLGSWAEYRYTLKLASREDAVYLGSTIEAPGFVEPVPSFYRTLGMHVQDLCKRVHFASRYSDPAGRGLRISLEACMEQLDGTATSQAEGNTRKERREIENQNLLNRLLPRESTEPWRLDEPAHRQELLGRLREFLARYDAGDTGTAAALAKLALENRNEASEHLWRLASTCYRLEAIAERQLAGQPWAKDDEFFIENYGIHLAGLMFYRGNSYLSPVDDAPRIARYASLTTPGKTTFYHAAISRPKLLLIRYPNREGKEVLCQGAVYDFRQVTRDRTLPLSEWHGESEKEKWPAWMIPIVAPAAPKKAE